MSTPLTNKSDLVITQNAHQTLARYQPTVDDPTNESSYTSNLRIVLQLLTEIDPHANIEGMLEDTFVVVPGIPDTLHHNSLDGIMHSGVPTDIRVVPCQEMMSKLVDG